MRRAKRLSEYLALGPRGRRALRVTGTRACETARDLTFPFRVRRLSGPASVAANEDEFVVVCLVRNGAVYLAEFLRHYRELGARHIVFLDNGSTDDTLAIAARESDVTVLLTKAPYKTYKDIMKRWLVTHFGRRNWVLCVDIDEFFDYPFRSEVSAPGLLRYLNSRRFTAVVAQMLDMFPQGVIAANLAPSWRDSHRFYSLNDLERVAYADFYGSRNEPQPGLEVMRGGVRSSTFQVKALLTKHPLLFPSGGLRYTHAHHVYGARVADLSAVLLHYKFVGDFSSYIKEIAEEESFSMNSREYKRYLHVLNAKPGMSLFSETASELSTVERLIEQGLLIASDRFRREAARLDGP